MIHYDASWMVALARSGTIQNYSTKVSADIVECLDVDM